MTNTQKIKLALLIGFTGLTLNLPYLIEVPKQVEAKTPDYNVYKPCWEKNSNESEWKYICEEKVVSAPSEQPKNQITPAPQNGEVVKLIKEVWGSDADKAIKIATCESGLRPDAVGDKNLNPASYGIFQIRAFKSRPSADKLLNARINVETAHNLFLAQGWRPWSCATKLGIK